MRAVVLLSGGLDSATTAAMAKAEGWDVDALTIRYGQVHAVELEAARRVAKAIGVDRHVELDIDLSAFGGSALVGDGAVPKGRDLDAAGVPSTYVPARNTVFLSLALAFAETRGADRIGIGVNAIDFSGYPDCRPDFLAAFERLAQLATRAGVEGREIRLYAPLATMSKAEIIRTGMRLGVDYGLTHSCYDPAPGGRPCGECDSCRLRARGFADAGVPDPLLPTGKTQPGRVKRLYYDDSLLLEFDATVTSVADYGGRPAVTLDRTAFYPTSGGQPFDTGTLGGASVVDVIDDEESGAILHVLDRALEPGAAVRGAIDRARRLDHMQQHTGQHILSAAFERLHQARTVSFHLGADASTIDLDRDVGPAAVAEAERLANEVVWDDRAVAVRYASEEEAAAMPLRKESKRTGMLRLVEVPGCDLSACGGTHVPRTGVIGMIAVSGTERFKGGLRVSFVCGARALSRFARMRAALDESVRRISVHPEDLAAAIGRLQDENKAQRQAIRAQQEKLAGSEAEALRARAETAGEVRLVVAHVPGWDAAGLKLLASALTTGAGVAAALVGDGTPAPVVIARSDAGALDAGAVLRAVIDQLGGKGGGKPGMAQGAVSAAPEQVRETLQAALRAALA